ncbi:VOC family protein [Streptomyces sp. NPDC058272]|uniref:VOC family protein n=1 Tax=Streptomyces sp. NPDC058272 TaxID=3346415 RepID=UPI0036F12ECF
MTRDTTTTHHVFGAPCWISLLTLDLSGAQAFYKSVLGWHFRPARLGAEFVTALVGGGPLVGIGSVAPALQVAATWTPFFAVTSANETAARIRERGATLAVGPLTFPVGRGALAADRDGAVFGIWQGQLVADWPRWRDSAPVCLRLRTRDALDAAMFYGQVLEWAGRRPGSCQVAYESDEVVVRQEGHVVARISSGAVESLPDPTVRPRWYVHFPVPDVAATIAAARRSGGSVVGHSRTAESELAILSDPEGAVFTVTGREPA